jgi:hypothetical protein
MTLQGVGELGLETSSPSSSENKTASKEEVEKSVATARLFLSSNNGKKS